MMTKYIPHKNGQHTHWELVPTVYAKLKGQHYSSMLLSQPGVNIAEDRPRNTWHYTKNLGVLLFVSLNGLPHGDIRRECLADANMWHGVGIVGLQPLFDEGSLVCLARWGDHRVGHDVRTNRTEKLVRDWFRDRFLEWYSRYLTVEISDMRIYCTTYIIN